MIKINSPEYDQLEAMHLKMINDPAYKRAMQLSSDAEMASIKTKYWNNREKNAAASRAHGLAANAWEKLDYPGSKKKAADHRSQQMNHHARAYRD